MIRKLIDVFVPDRHEPLKLEGVETWMVQWDSRNGRYSSDLKSVAHAFTNKKDAYEFAESLREAFKLIKNSSEINSIMVSKS